MTETRPGLWILLLASLSISACQPSTEDASPGDAGGPADLVLQGGKFFTVDEAQVWAEAVAIKHGRFVYVGDTGIPGDLGGIEGSEQFALFLLGAAVATALTASLASLLHMKGTLPGQPQPGMEGLRDGTLLQLLILRIRSSRRDAGRR